MSEQLWVLSADASHAPAEERDRIRRQALTLIANHPRWALLSTCHRVEIYGLGEAPKVAGMRNERGEAAARRLIRVASGLESASVGEDEILHQVRSALTHFRRRRSADPALARLMEIAIAAGRRARAISRPPSPSLAERAVGWLAARARLAGETVVVAGNGTMGRALKSAVEGAGARVILTSRTPKPGVLDLAQGALAAEGAVALAVALAGSWEELARVSSLPPVADLSAPPAVPEILRQAQGHRYLGVDDLFQRTKVDAGWVAQAESEVEVSVQEYLDWFHGRSSVDTLRALASRSELRRDERLQRLLRRLPSLSERDRELVAGFSRQLVTDLLHEPLSGLRADRDGSLAQAAKRLFDL